MSIVLSLCKLFLIIIIFSWLLNIKDNKYSVFNRWSPSLCLGLGVMQMVVKFHF